MWTGNGLFILFYYWELRQAVAEIKVAQSYLDYVFFPRVLYLTVKAVPFIKIIPLELS